MNKIARVQRTYLRILNDWLSLCGMDGDIDTSVPLVKVGRSMYSRSLPRPLEVLNYVPPISAPLFIASAMIHPTFPADMNNVCN